MPVRVWNTQKRTLCVHLSQHIDLCLRLQLLWCFLINVFY
jgi:hypothetical protein